MRLLFSVLQMSQMRHRMKLDTKKHRLKEGETETDHSEPLRL
jgi:hypothetical protein